MLILNPKFLFIIFWLKFIIVGASSAAQNDLLTKFDVIQPVTSDDQQLEAARSIIERIIPDRAEQFNVVVDFRLSKDGKDTFSIVSNGGKIKIVGSSGVAVAWGFNYYMKNFCDCHIGWQVRQVSLPEKLPAVNVTVTAQDRFRYYQNVCTTSYSMVWWDERSWREHIDWLALNGLNLVLVSHAQEAVWTRVYKRLNLTQQEINDFFAGPAFLSWQRMGNIQRWGGPLSEDWHQTELQTQHYILQSLRSLGITPVLPAFAGFVPKAFKRLFPNAKMSEVERWNNFETQFCCPLFLDPNDELFGVVGKMFLTEITQEFGMSHIYNSDPFNEVKPTSSDVTFLANVGREIHKSMTSVDPDAVWLLQNWMFVHEVEFWNHERVKALLTSVPSGKILVLDLQSEQWPQYKKFDNYFGQPFIWCMLHNFGGTLGMFGDSESVNKEVYVSRSAANSTMMGIGLTPEGINQNYVMYELMLESSIRNTSVDMTAWIRDYTHRRYGGLNADVEAAWSILMGSVYNYTGLNKIRGKYAITRRPSLDIKPWAWYPSSALLESWRRMCSAHPQLSSSQGYQHDLVDLTRQALQYTGDQIYPLIVRAFKTKSAADLQKHGALFLDLLEDLQVLLSSSKDFLLGQWLEAAKAIARNDQDRKLFEYNARSQITLWGPNGEIVDYANKQWAGIVSDVIIPRWSVFLKALQDCIVNSCNYNKTAVIKEMFTTVERPFTFSQKLYPVDPIGDPVSISLSLFDKWSAMPALPDVPMGFIKKPAEKDAKLETGLLTRLSRDTEEDIKESHGKPHYHAILIH